MLNLVNTVVEFLKQNQDHKFTAREIASWIFETYPNECRKKQKRSTAIINPLDNDTALLQQISAEIGSQRPRLQKRYPEIKTTESRPRKYYFSEATDIAEIEYAESAKTSPIEKKNSAKIKESNLYPLLSNFLLSELDIYSMRIDEKRSSNSQGAGGNKWLYPDVVGIEDLSFDWHSEIKSCVQQYADRKTKLWSFEVKILINRSNLRKAFFSSCQQLFMGELWLPSCQ